MTGVYSDCSNREIIIITVIVVVVIIIISTASSVTYRCGLLLQTVHWRGEGVRGCGPHRAALARGGKRAKIVFKIFT